MTQQSSTRTDDLLNEANRAKFEKDGFFVLPELFSGAEIDTLVQHLDPFARAHEEELKQQGINQGINRANEITFTTHLTAKDPFIMEFIKRPEFVTLATGLLGPNVSLYWDQSVYKKPETPRDFPWHQDNGYTPVDPQQYLTCWLALNDATVENGCIWALPGSHKQGLIDHQATETGKKGYFGDEQGVPVPLQKGGVIVFSSLLLHRSGPNLSQGVRKAYIIQYTPVGAINLRTGALVERAPVARNGLAVRT